MERKAEAAGSWWDTLGKPQYGGEMVIRSTANIANFDPYYSDHIIQIYTAWTEKLYAKNWLLNRAIFDHKVLLPPQFLNGHTYVVHLRKGIHWQNIPPVNGREFTADDVVFHYHRLYGLGSGFMKPAPYHATVTAYHSLISVTAIDKYTVEFKWKTPNREFII